MTNDEPSNRPHPLMMPSETDPTGLVAERCKQCGAWLYTNGVSPPICLNGCMLTGAAYRALQNPEWLGRLIDDKEHS